MLRLLVLENPLLVKHVRARLRRRHLTPLIGLTIVTCGIIAWTGALYADTGRGLTRGHFMFLLFGQAGVLLLLGTLRAASAVSEAREGGMLDFHRISPQPPLALGVGFLLGGPIREWVLFACTVPFSLLLAALCEVGLLAWLALMLALVLTALFYHLIAVVVALSVPELRGGAAGIVLVVWFMHMGIIPLALETGLPLAHLTVVPTAAVALDPSAGQDMLPRGLPHHALSALSLALLHQVPLAFFIFLALERKMRDQAAPAYAKSTAVLFYLTVAALSVLGAALAPPPRSPLEITPFSSLTYLLLGVGILLTLAVTPDRSQFARGVRQARKSGLSEASPWSDGAVNWSVVPIFALVLVAASLTALTPAARQPGAGASAFAGAAVAAFTLLFFGYAKQSLDLAYGKLSRTYFGALLFALWVLPLLLGMLAGIAGAFEASGAPIIAASPLAGIHMALSEPIRHRLPPTTAVAVIAALVPAVGFAVLNPSQVRRARQDLEQVG